MKSNNTARPQAPQTKYATLGRSSLLSIIIFSIINMISMPLANSHFLFSSYFPFYCTVLGVSFESTALLLLFSALGLVLLTPYILCYVFSSRHVGWMIGATVLFAIESLFAVGDALLMLATGVPSMLMDGIFHIVISVMLIMASVNGVRRSREGLPLVTLTDAELEAANTPASFAPPATAAEQTDANVTEAVTADAVPSDAAQAQAQEIPTPVHSEAVEKEREQQDKRWE